VTKCAAMNVVKPSTLNHFPDYGNLDSVWPRDHKNPGKIDETSLLASPHPRESGPKVIQEPRGVVMLRSERPSGKCANLHTVAASNNRNHLTRSLYYCFPRHMYMGVILRAYSVHAESHIQRNANR